MSYLSCGCVEFSLRESARWRPLQTTFSHLAPIPAGSPAAGPFFPRPPLPLSGPGESQVCFHHPFSPDALARDFFARGEYDLFGGQPAHSLSRRPESQHHFGLAVLRPPNPINTVCSMYLPC